MNVLRETTKNYMTNVYLVDDGKHGFIIDPGERVLLIEDYIKKNNIEIEFILLTHGHFDHISKANYYKKKYDVEILGGFEEKEVFMDPEINLSSMMDNPVSIKIDRYLKDEEIFSRFNIKAIHTPGHTKGGYSYLLDDIIFSGDTLFRNSVGRTDFPTGNLDDLINSINNKLFIYPGKKVYPGHDIDTTINYEIDNNPYFN